jgi:hypothetical protein
LVEQRFGVFQDRRIEAFGEPAMDRGEKMVGPLPLALIAPEAGKAGCGAQFPTLRALSTRDVDGLTEGDLRTR